MPIQLQDANNQTTPSKATAKEFRIMERSSWGMKLKKPERLTVNVVAVTPKPTPGISPEERRKDVMPLSTYKTSRIKVEIVHIRRYDRPQPSVNGRFIRGWWHGGHENPAGVTAISHHTPSSSSSLGGKYMKTHSSVNVERA